MLWSCQSGFVLTFSFSLVYDRSCIERFAYKGVILVPTDVPCICKKCLSAKQRSFIVRIMHMKSESGNIACTCVEEMTTCIDAFIVWDVSVER